MKPEYMKNLPKAPEGMSLADALRIACLAWDIPVPLDAGEKEEDTYEKEAFDENGRPRYILCDEIWEILAEAGHGCEIIVHKENPETLYYDDFASQINNVHFMNHLSEMMDEGYTITVNGTDIFDLY